jgi:Ceramidase
MGRMSWSEPVSAYCERTSAAFWAEPVNALTNGAFLIAALLAFLLWRQRARDDLATLALIVVTVLVGFGSFAFHTLATRGAVLLDIIPIALFVYGYLLVALRRYLDLPMLASAIILAAFIALTRGLAFLPPSVLPPDFLNGSYEYLPPLAALIVVGGLVRSRSKPADDGSVGSAILLAAAIFVVSLALRTIDRAVCASFPLGTHFLWHLLNAVVLYVLLRTAILAVGNR